MSYADIVKRQLTSEPELWYIRSQAETELGRKLLLEEEALLFEKFRPDTLFKQIKKVS